MVVRSTRLDAERAATFRQPLRLLLAPDLHRDAKVAIVPPLEFEVAVRRLEEGEEAAVAEAEEGVPHLGLPPGPCGADVERAGQLEAGEVLLELPHFPGIAAAMGEEVEGAHGHDAAAPACAARWQGGGRATPPTAR
jgi:hypothetical protein